MKTHDCHVLMEILLPIVFRALPYQVWNPIAELSKFFKDMCSTILRVDDLLLMEKNIIITTCKLERIFPPGFFNSMEHLPIHLPYEARVHGALNSNSNPNVNESFQTSHCAPPPLVQGVQSTNPNPTPMDDRPNLGSDQTNSK